MKRFVCAALAAILSTAALSAEIRVLSAGAVEPGLHAFADLVKRETGHTLAIQFNTGPRIAKRLADKEVYDILISPPPAIAQALASGQLVADTKTTVGRVGAGIIVRSSASAPDVSTADALKRALLAADSIVYNTASTGIYLDKLFAQLGILDAIVVREHLKERCIPPVLFKQSIQRHGTPSGEVTDVWTTYATCSACTAPPPRTTPT